MNCDICKTKATLSEYIAPNGEKVNVCPTCLHQLKACDGFISGMLSEAQDEIARLKERIEELEGRELHSRTWLPKECGQVWQWFGNREEADWESFIPSLSIGQLAAGLLFKTKEEAETIGRKRYEELLKQYEEARDGQ